KDFARHHPNGSIGRTLLLKTKDIMRTGSMNAIADKSLTIKEALMIMIRAQSGSISVVNKAGKLVGVFTDGDLRRHMAKDENALQSRLENVMTPKPICVRDDALAAEALKIFNERKIDDLIVVNSKYQPVGLIDSQDLPKLKLM
ncbi:MAG: arabinose 5-phosphate isomerase, partial [Verrucomicrobiales bacterium]|nr:arabinose 5-phosphate isomerase [Verrucomicrobiales bacterium]